MSMMLSDVIEAAANEQLWTGLTTKSTVSESDKPFIRWVYAWSAAVSTIEYLAPSSEWIRLKAVFESITMKMGSTNNDFEFREFSSGEVRQRERFAWLMFVALFMRDEGLDVPVTL